VASLLLSGLLWLCFGSCILSKYIVAQNIQEHARARFSATEMALQNVCEMLSFAATIAFPLPGQFQYPVLISAGAVAVAAGCFATYVRKERGHLLHRVRCLGGDKVVYRAVESGQV
jgi:iron-regulated transporter 1